MNISGIFFIKYASSFFGKFIYFDGGFLYQKAKKYECSAFVHLPQKYNATSFFYITDPCSKNGIKNKWAKIFSLFPYPCTKTTLVIYDSL